MFGFALIPGGLKKFLKKSIVKKELSDQLGVIDAKLGNLIKTKLDIECMFILHVFNTSVMC